MTLREVSDKLGVHPYDLVGEGMEKITVVGVTLILCVLAGIAG